MDELVGQQRLGHSQDAFAMKLVTCTEAQFFHFFFERPLSHVSYMGASRAQRRYRVLEQIGCSLISVLLCRLILAGPDGIRLPPPHFSRGLYVQTNV